MRFGSRPFVYLSDAVLTDFQPVLRLAEVAKNIGVSVNRDLLHDAFSTSYRSIRSQAVRYKPQPGTYAPQRHQKWLGSVCEAVSGALVMDTEQRRAFLSAAPGALMRVQNHAVSDQTRAFLNSLESAGILWGVVANDDHLYQAVLKYVGLKPFTVVSAREGVFKPLPSMFRKAFEKVPKDSKDDVWFVGSINAPYDNVVSPHMSTVILTDGGPSDISKSVEELQRSRHFRIAALKELSPILGLGPRRFGDFDPLGSSEFGSDLGLDFGALLDGPAPKTNPSAVSREQKQPALKKNVLLPLGTREHGLVDLD